MWPLEPRTLSCERKLRGGGKKKGDCLHFSTSVSVPLSKTRQTRHAEGEARMGRIDGCVGDAWRPLLLFLSAQVFICSDGGCTLLQSLLATLFKTCNVSRLWLNIYWPCRKTKWTWTPKCFFFFPPRPFHPNLLLFFRWDIKLFGWNKNESVHFMI